MNTIKAAAILFLATAAVAASAADLAAVPAGTAAGPTQVTRAAVKQELQLAIANGEIRHGDLVDFEALVAPTAQRTALADNRSKPAQMNLVGDAQTRTAQATDTAAKSSGH